MPALLTDSSRPANLYTRKSTFLCFRRTPGANTYCYRDLLKVLAAFERKVHALERSGPEHLILTARPHLYEVSTLPLLHGHLQEYREGRLRRVPERKMPHPELPQLDSPEAVIAWIAQLSQDQPLPPLKSLHTASSQYRISWP